MAHNINLLALRAYLVWKVRAPLFTRRAVLRTAASSRENCRGSDVLLCVQGEGKVGAYREDDGEDLSLGDQVLAEVRQVLSLHCLTHSIHILQTELIQTLFNPSQQNTWICIGSDV